MSDQMTPTDGERSTASARTDATDVEELVTEWVPRGWHLEPGQMFDFAGCSNASTNGTLDAVLHDNADPQRTTAHSAAEYAAIWDTGLTNLTALSKTLDDRPHVVVAGDLAIVDICFISRFEFEDGNTDVAPTRRSLVLRRDGNRWLIFRQHGSALSPHT